MLKTILFGYRTAHVLFFSTFDIIPHTNTYEFECNIFDAEKQVFVSRSKYFHFEKLVHDDCVLFLLRFEIIISFFL